MNKLVLMLLTILSMNCLSFRSGEYKNAEKISKFETPQKPVIKVNIKYDYFVDSSKEPNVPQTLIDAWAKVSEDTLKEIPDITYTREDLLATHFFDTTIIEETNSFSASISPFISGFTLGVIPAYISSDLTVKTIVKDKKGTVLGEVSKKESLTLVGQILLAFANIFVQPADMIKAQKEDLLRASYSEIKKNQFLKSRK